MTLSADERVWLETQFLMVLTGWTPRDVAALSRAERHAALIFRQRWRERERKQEE